MIVEFASSKVTGPLGTLTIDIVGQGKGLLLTNGKIININWQKDDPSQRTKFTTQDGKEIILSPGQTWVSVLDPKDIIEKEPSQEKNADENSSDNVESK